MSTTKKNHTSRTNHNTDRKTPKRHNPSYTPTHHALARKLITR